MSSCELKQAGTGPSRRHIQGSKIAKRLPSFKYSLLQYSKIEHFSKKKSKKLPTQKNGPSAKVSQCRKTERGDPLRFFNIHSVAKHEKIEENKNFYSREKISQCRKKTERVTLWPFGIFQHPFCRKTSKEMQGDTLGKFFFLKKVSQCRKNERGDPLVSPVLYVTRKNRKNFFGSVR